MEVVNRQSVQQQKRGVNYEKLIGSGTALDHLQTKQHHGF
jgi:hypothetical protein